MGYDGFLYWTLTITGSTLAGRIGKIAAFLRVITMNSGYIIGDIHQQWLNIRWLKTNPVMNRRWFTNPTLQSFSKFPSMWIQFDGHILNQAGGPEILLWLLWGANLMVTIHSSSKGGNIATLLDDPPSNAQGQRLVDQFIQMGLCQNSILKTHGFLVKSSFFGGLLVTLFWHIPRL